ncbi:hypothetical protein WA538_001719 [Blastocystis sp. DL]
MGAAPSKTTAEILQDNKNAIRTSIREIDREERQIERRRKEVEAKIKAAAKKGNVNEVRVFAKDLVRIKKAVEKFEIAKANLQQIQIQLMTASGQEAIMSALKGAVGAYKSLNKLMDPKGMQRIMAEYQKESMRQEIMSEVMDDTMSMNDDTVAEDTMVDQVLQEIGVSITGDMVKAGTDQQAAPAETSAVDTGLQDRLNNL